MNDTQQYQWEPITGLWQYDTLDNVWVEYEDGTIETGSDGDYAPIVTLPPDVRLCRKVEAQPVPVEIVQDMPAGVRDILDCTILFMLSPHHPVEMKADAKLLRAWLESLKGEGDE